MPSHPSPQQNAAAPPDTQQLPHQNNRSATGQINGSESGSSYVLRWQKEEKLSKHNLSLKQAEL